MITYIEKGHFLHKAVNDAGHKLEDKDGVWISSDDNAVQLIINNFEPLEDERKEAKKRLIEQFEEATKDLEASYPESEKRTFTKQEVEARSFITDNTARTPTLSQISSGRGKTVLDVALKVVEKADIYTAQIGALIGIRQAKEDLIDSESDWEIIATISLLDA